MTLPAFILPYIPVLLLTASNVFMMFAWYGHLKFPQVGLITVILASWGIAFIEYCLAVPANRIGYQFFSAPELRTMQVVISLIVFCGFCVFYLGEKISLMHGAGFTLIALGTALVFFAGREGE